MIEMVAKFRIVTPLFMSGFERSQAPSCLGFKTLPNSSYFKSLIYLKKILNFRPVVVLNAILSTNNG